MKILITGASGLIGQALITYLQEKGHEVKTLSRTHSILWNPAKGMLTPHDLEGFDAIVNLSGENIAGRWTEVKKEKIIKSRLDATKTLVNAISTLKHPPKVLVNASAIGYYGNRGDEKLDEKSTIGKGFLAEVCREWEEAASNATTRVVYLRTGVVLSKKGGALAKMLTPFKLGLGGNIGDGNQWMSWIAIDDHIRAVEHLIENEIKGPVNLVSPDAVTNREFTKTLGEVLHRPTMLPLPAFMVRVLFGEMGEETLLSSARVVPTVLEQSGFKFKYPQLKPALEHLLK